ncbi:multidrug resistance protein MdtA-like [Nilaparvata lugens]|uniref:multidrug resistance protein MdtA-like n=1 Tax=Nilaparvata lugens TaxID=108931 RepID=UPI00193DFA30|nr:multidrug resistance protein MdtA-like [Nilaparvata lugens]
MLRLLVAAIVAIVAVLIWRHFNAAPPAAETQAAARPAGGAKGAAAGGKRRGNLSPVQVATATQQSVPSYLIGLGTSPPPIPLPSPAGSTATDDVALHRRAAGESRRSAGGNRSPAIPGPVDPGSGAAGEDQATLANARRDLARYQQLVKTNLVSRQELDTQASLVQQTEGSIKADQGAVDMGNYITSGSTAIVVITQTHPIDVVFTLPESTLSDIMKAQKAGPVSVEAWGRTNKTLLAQGNLLSLDNQIDTTTGTIKLKAQYANQDDALFPNQFVMRG